RAHKKDGVTRPFCCLVFAGVYSQARRLQATQVVEHHLVVVFGLKAIKDVLHGALLINQEADAMDAIVHFANGIALLRFFSHKPRYFTYNILFNMQL
ncbi:MAG: hypothetical protein ACRC76_12930, partial [Proteocatella sp.]